MSDQLLEALRQWAHQVTADVQNDRQARRLAPDEVLSANMRRLEDAIQLEKVQ